MSFGEKLRAARKEREVTQKTLGAALGLSYQMIWFYEHDLRKPKDERVKEIADYLEMTIEELVK